MVQERYDAALKYIHSLGMYSRNKPKDLRKMQYLCSLLGNPQECFDVIHIAGTNGKGSVTAMIFNIFSELGYTTGKYISPFIERFNERIAVNGCDISDGDLAVYTDLVREKINNIPEEFLPNEFEFVTLMAFLYYKDCGCDIVALETGLGGRLDPTNIIKKPLASIIMSISLEHTEILGDTLEEIAYEKCGIIKENSSTVIYPLNQENIIEYIKNTASEKNNVAFTPDISQVDIISETLEYTLFEYKNIKYKIKLIGTHQIYNAITAIETVMSLFNHKKIKIQNRVPIDEAVYRGLEKTYFPARLEILSQSPLLIFDGAHNISGVETLCENIAKLLSDKKITLVCAMLRDKKPETALKGILSLPQINRFVAAAVDSKRAMSPEELCETAKRYCRNCEYTYDLRDTLKRLMIEIDSETDRDNAIVCFGSLFLTKDVKNIVREINGI